MALDLNSVTRFMEENARPAADIEAPKYFGLHLGPGGSGKTSILGSLPGKTLIIDSEGGTLPLRERANVDIVECHSWEDLRQALFFIEKADHDYESIGLDGLARFQQYDIAAILRQFDKKFMELQLWGVTLEHMTLALAWLRALSGERGLHIAASCLEREVKDGEIIVQRRPDLQGQIAGRVAPLFDTVAYHMVKEHAPKEGHEHGELEFRALTKPYGTRNLARDRYGVLDGVERLTLEDGGGITAWVERIEAAVLEEGAEPKAEASGSAPVMAKNKAAKKGRKGKPAPVDPAKKAAAKKADTPPEPEAPEEEPESTSSQEEPETPGDSQSTSPTTSSSEMDTGTDKDITEIAIDVKARFGNLVGKASHLEDRAIKALTAALKEAGYPKLGDAVDKDDIAAVMLVRDKWSEFEAEMLAVE